jgi:protein TonB
VLNIAPKEPDPKLVTIKPKDPDPKPKEPDPKKPDVKAVSYKEVAPILRTYCGNCHGQVGKPKGGVDLRSFAAIKKGDENGKALVVPGNPEKSPLYESITAGRMPDGGKTPPNPKELQLLHDWIASGAKERRRPVRVRPNRRIRLARRMELTDRTEAG